MQEERDISEREAALLRVSQENERLVALAKTSLPKCLKCSERTGSGVTFKVSGIWIHLCRLCHERMQEDLNGYSSEPVTNVDVQKKEEGSTSA